MRQSHYPPQWLSPNPRNVRDDLDETPQPVDRLGTCNRYIVEHSPSSSHPFFNSRHRRFELMLNRVTVQIGKQSGKSLTLAIFSLLSVLLPPIVPAQTPKATQRIPDTVMLRIVRAEDERRWDRDLGVLLSDKAPAVRKRAALAAGRIGNQRAVEMLIPLVEKDPNGEVRAMAAFALGEIESGAAIKALSLLIDLDTPADIRARAVESLGKIAAALPKTEEAQANVARGEILRALKLEADRRSGPDLEVIELGITAALRARPEGAGKLIASFLRYPDPIPAVAANALARLRAKDGNEELRKLLSSGKDPMVRANAARVLGATDDKEAFAALLDRAANDEDSRVRVSSIRALAALKDPRTTEPLISRGEALLTKHSSARSNPESVVDELLEIAVSLGAIAAQTNSRQVVDFLERVRTATGSIAPEVEIAIVRVWPQHFVTGFREPAAGSDWRVWSARAQGAAELANIKTSNSVLDESNRNAAVRNLNYWLSCPSASSARKRVPLKPRAADRVVGTRCNPIPTLAVPDALRAYAAFKQPDTALVLRTHLTAEDVGIRGTAADLIGELTPDEINSKALVTALQKALTDKDSNDAVLSTLSALGKQKTAFANEAIQTTIDSADSLVRGRAVSLLKENNAGDFSSRVIVVNSKNNNDDYLRAISRIGKSVRATVVTNKGRFIIELLPDDAPLNVDNFIKLARSGYFRGITFHRVVANFVVQGGDPRGDGNGGPGYSVRCEINEVPYERGAVGMALSGKDTGGSQWFVTHSPQPHLDGGYTVFGSVISGMEVVDEIVRGDVIRSITITETKKAPNANARNGQR